MVGVPGRSKGCSTCRRRKKGCDKQAPVCGQCRALGLVCGGYERDRIWINTTAQAVVATGSRPPRECTSIALHSSFARTAREAQYFGLYCSSYLPKGRQAVSLEASQFEPRMWISLLEQLFHTDDALRHVVLALSASVLGTERNDAQLRLKGLQTYTDSVRTIAAAVEDSQRVTADAVLAAVKLSAFYEILFGLDGKQYSQMGRVSQIMGWAGHMDGELALVQRRGPLAFRSGTAHRIFVEGRHELANTAIMRRKSVFLSEPAWLTLPWETNDRTMKARIIDVLVKVPTCLEALDRARRIENVTSSNLSFEALVAQCQALHHDVQQWRQDLGDSINVFDYNLAGLPLPTPSTDADFELLHLSILSWTVEMFLTSTWEMALAEYAQPNITTPQRTQGVFRPENTIPPPHMPTPEYSSRSYANRIAYSIHLFFSPGTGAWGANAALMALGNALRLYMVLEPNSKMGKERQLLVDCFLRPYMGTFVGRFLKNFLEDDLGPKLDDASLMEQLEARCREWWLEGYD